MTSSWPAGPIYGPGEHYKISTAEYVRNVGKYNNLNTGRVGLGQNLLHAALSPDLIMVERVLCRGHPHEAPAGAFAVVDPVEQGCGRQLRRESERSRADADERGRKGRGRASVMTIANCVFEGRSMPGQCDARFKGETSGSLIFRLSVKAETRPTAP